MKGKPTSNTIIYKHSSFNGNPTMMTDSDSVTLNISFTAIFRTEFTSMFLTCISRLPRVSRFSYTASAVGLDTKQIRYTSIEK